jgi:hypothetical protein
VIFLSGSAVFFLVFTSRTPYRVAHGVGRVGNLIPVTLVLES